MAGLVISRLNLVAILGIVLTLCSVDSAFALSINDIDADDIARNMVISSEFMPGLITGVSYLLGILFAITGVLKLRDHVENPGQGGGQTPLRTPLIRFLIAGAMFALPIVYEAMETTLNAGNDAAFDAGIFSFGGLLGGILGPLSGLLGGLTMDLNSIMGNFVGSVEKLPALVSAVSYLLGLLLGVTGLVKIKDHVENPEQTPLKEGVIRLLAGGALFATPAVFEAMSSLITGGDGLGLMGIVTSGLGALNWIKSGYAGGGLLGGWCNPIGNSVGNSLCSIILHTGVLPAFLSAISYLIGLVLGVWGILKLRDHVLNPTQTALSEGITRFIAGGAFFALPVAVEAVRTTMTPLLLTGIAFKPITTYNDAAAPKNCEGLDGALYCMMADITGPVHSLVSFFAFCAGTIFIMIGISRLIKSSQEGARGPGGIGTVMTFAVGGALISFNELIRAFTMSFFDTPITKTSAQLVYDTGISGGALDHVHVVISAILKFMIVVGLISFVRGLFIVRSVAEGNQQASVMAGVTHMVGGALAVNLGPLMNAVQTTLGITGYGITFS